MATADLFAIDLLRLGGTLKGPVAHVPKSLSTVPRISSCCGPSETFARRTRETKPKGRGICKVKTTPVLAMLQLTLRFRILNMRHEMPLSPARSCCR